MAGHGATGPGFLWHLALAGADPVLALGYRAYLGVPLGPHEGTLHGVLSVYGSAMLWSMMHYEAWPAPIPLFLLGLALGWLALRTQSLIGPMVLHSLFNGVACVQLLTLH